MRAPLTALAFAAGLVPAWAGPCDHWQGSPHHRRCLETLAAEQAKQRQDMQAGLAALTAWLQRFGARYETPDDMIDMEVRVRQRYGFALAWRRCYRGTEAPDALAPVLACLAREEEIARRMGQDLARPQPACE